MHCNINPQSKTLLLSFILIALLSNFLIAQPKNSAKSQSPPNVVIIFMDDMGYGDPVCYGGGPYQTPNIDALAMQGMRFTDFYAAQAACTASRSALLTGCYPTRIGMHGAIDDKSKIAINPDEQTIAEILKPAGYRTAIVGKWHLGSNEPYMPLQNGFDEYFGLPYSNDMWPMDYSGKPWKDTSFWRAKYAPLPLYDGNNVIKIIKTLDDQSQLTTMYTRRAVKFISENKNRPFFLYLAQSMVHVPIAVSAKFRGKSGAGLFGDVMEEVDWSVGEVMKELKKDGIADNTLIIFTSDNGPWLTFGNHAGNTGGLREGKGTAWDGGLKVPGIMVWPGKIKPGTVCNKLLITMDILPTLVDFCKAKMPVKKIDGVDISKVLLGDNATNPRDIFVYYYDINNLKAIRNQEWKLVFPCTSQTYGPPATIGRDGYPGKYSSDSVHLGLYNLLTDPGEGRDVKDQYPEIVKELTSIADEYREKLGDGFNNEVGSEVRPPAILQ